MSIALLFGTLFICLLIGVPVAISLGVSAVVAIYFGTTLPMDTIIQKALSGLDSAPLLAIPFFILAGILMGKGGVSQRLLDLASAIVGWITGGLSLVTIVASMFFAAISGSGPATVAAIGSFMIPAMIANKYHEGFSAAVTATSGAIGVIIPPSIPFVLYGVVGSVSVGSMFLAGIFPGILIGVGLMITSFIISKKRNYKSGDSSNFDFKNVLKKLNEAKWAIFVPIIILGGIYGGVFSPTESAAVAVVYALIVGMFVYKELDRKTLFESFREAVVLNVITMFIIGLSVSFAYFLTIEKIPSEIAEMLTSYSENQVVILAMIVLLLLIVGMFIDTVSAVIVLTPILLPVATNVDIDPVHFGVVMVLTLAIGFVTPPLGVNLFVASSVGGVRFEKISIAAIPFIISMIICVLLIILVPSFSTWLPNFFE